MKPALKFGLIALLLGVFLAPSYSLLVKRRPIVSVTCSGNKGYTSQGANLVDTNSGNMAVDKWVADCSGTSTAMWVYVANADEINNAAFRCVLYSDSGDSPNTLLDWEAVVQAAANDGFVECPGLDYAVSQGQTYWMGLQSGDTDVSYADETVGGYTVTGTNTYGTGPPATFPSATPSAHKLSVYLVF